MIIQDITALVTGANRGLGLEIVGALLRAGVGIVYAGARNIETLADAVAFDAARVRPLRLDVTSASDIERAARDAAATSLLINNAGVLDFAGPLETDDEIIDRNMAVNFNGTMAMTRAFAPVIVRNGGGDVVNILTFLSFVSAPVFAAYGASKAASWAMAMSLRPVLAPDGVRVVNVFPTTIDTEMVAGLDKPKDTARDVAGEIVSGIIEGREDIYPCKASATFAAWRTDQKAVERQFAKLVSR